VINIQNNTFLRGILLCSD